MFKYLFSNTQVQGVLPESLNQLSPRVHFTNLLTPAINYAH